MFKKVVTIVGIVLFALTVEASDYRHEIDLSGKWKCQQVKKSNTEKDLDYYKISCNDKEWGEIDLPMYVSRGVAERYRNAWYRNIVNVPENLKGKRVILRFEGAGYETHVWVNEKYAGLHRGGLTAFEIEVSRYIKFGEGNLIAIKCINDNVYPNANSLVFMHPKLAIWAPLKLVFVPQIYIKRTLISTDIKTSSINVEYWIDNETGIKRDININSDIESYKDKTITDSASFENIALDPGLNKLNYSIKMKNPIYWELWKPYLYNLKIELREGDKGIDSLTERFGYRTFEAKGKNFYFNGRRIKLYGQTSYWLPLPQEVKPDKEERKKVIEDNTKPFGCNLIRYFDPLPQCIYEAADELGILVYAQWASWAGFVNLSDNEKYLESNIEEMKEWIYQIYNNPSVVMISQTNEDWSHVTQLNKGYEALKPIVKSNKLICPSAGLYSWSEKLPDCGADFIDFHNYTGNSTPVIGSPQKLPWTYIKDTIISAHENLDIIYGEKFNKPIIIGEVAGQIAFSSSPQIHKVYLAYNEDKKKGFVVASQDRDSMSISWDLTKVPLEERMDIRNMTNPNDARSGWHRDFYEGYNRMNKRCLETLRQMEIIQGIIPNGVYSDFDYVDIFPEIYNPVFICLEPFDANLFTGDNLTCRINIINDLDEVLSGLKININITDQKGNLIYKEDIDAGNVINFTKKIIDYRWGIPSDITTGFYKIYLELIQNDKKISYNKYDFYILQKNDLIKKIKTDLKVGVYLPKKVENIGRRTCKILDDLNIGYGIVRDDYNTPRDLENTLNNYNVLIIPAFYDETIKKWSEIDERLEMSTGRTINYWIEQGGNLLVFEQSSLYAIPWIPMWNIVDGNPNVFIDMGIPEHPIFNGLVQANFDTWNVSYKKGVNNRYLISPITENILAATTSLLTGEICMLTAEAKIGKGKLFMSQIEAVDRYGYDSSATKYIQNILAYMLGVKGQDWTDVRGTEGQEIRKYNVNLEKCFYVDLKPYVNQGFRNNAERGKMWSGWTDEGDNDLRHIPLGEDNAEKKYWEMVYHQELKDKQIFLGVPFDIIDPAKNMGKSCLFLKGIERDYFPGKVEGIKVNAQLEKLYFLHASAWTFSSDVGKYIIHYTDGTHIEIPLIKGKNIADWWGPKDLPEAKVAWSGENPESHQVVGLYIMPWANPNPDKLIKSIDFISGSLPVPILVAITGIVK